MGIAVSVFRAISAYFWTMYVMPEAGQFAPASIPKQWHIWIATHINMVFSKVTAQQFGSLFHKGHSTNLPTFSVQSNYCWKIQSHIPANKYPQVH